MRPGILEIVVIIAIIIAIVLVTRIYRGNRDVTEQSKKSSEEITHWQVKEKVGRTHNYLKRVGIAFFIAGIILALAGMSMFKWAVQSYVWSFIIVGVGLALLFLSRKK
jgi:uncharacterized ion transporter superfamily protein YfcC